MARGRIRKSDKGSFTEEQMRKAVEEVLKNNTTLRKSAEMYNVKHQTLARYVSKQRQNAGLKIRMTPKYDCRKVFTAEQELVLVKYILQCSKMCYGQTTFDVRGLAYEMAVVNGINIPTNWKEHKKAGLEWLHGFLKRHPNVSIRRPENCSLSRMTAFNFHNVKCFFDNLRTILQRNPEVFQDGCRIYNLDETSTTTVQKCAKILAEKGMKQVSKAVSGERGTLVTTCCIISAGGHALPPAMVFPRKKFHHKMIQNAPGGTLGLVSSSGWMTSEVFPQVMEHFIKYSYSSKENPSLLIYDNHESHISIEAIRTAKENGVTILTLPPHCSHRLQPLDISIFFPFKSFYNSAVDAWMIKNPGRTVTIYEIGEFVSVAHDRAMSPQNIKSGFKTAGIFPFDDRVFSDEDYMSSSVSDRPITEAQTNLPQNYSCSDVQTNYEEPSSLKIQFRNNTPSPSASSSTTQKKVNIISDIVLVSPNTNDKLIDQKEFISPEVIRGLPKAVPRKKTTRRKKGRSFIPTDTPEKENLEIMEQEKRKRKMKITKQKSVKRPVLQESQPKKLSESEISEDESFISASSSDYDIEEEMKNAREEKKWEEQEIEKNDFILVKFVVNKKEFFYVGQILTINDETMKVKFLRKSQKARNKFYFPNIDDISTIKKEDIFMLLPKPEISGTKRQQQYLLFKVDFLYMDVR